jgi:hypothetical protein
VGNGGLHAGRSGRRRLLGPWWITEDEPDGTPGPDVRVGRDEHDGRRPEHPPNEGGGSAEALDLGEDRRQERATGRSHTAPDGDPVDVVGHRQEVDGPGDMAPDPIGDLDGDRIALGRRLEDSPSGRWLRPLEASESTRRYRLARLASNRRPRGDRLEAADEPAATGRSCRVDDEVADLAGEAVPTAMEPPVEDDPGRDPGPDAEKGKVTDR